MRGATGLCLLSIATDPRCVAGACALRHHSPQYKIFAQDFEERKRDEPIPPEKLVAGARFELATFRL